MTSAIALRYAHALADVVLAPGSGVSAEDALTQFRGFSAMLEDSPELRGAMLSPAVPASRKRAVIAKLGEMTGLSRPVRNFLFVIVDHRRVTLASGMAEGLESIFDEHFGFARADISTAREFDPAQTSALEAELGRMTGKWIRPRYAVDPSLLGGAVARIGSTVYDGSVRGQLEQLRRNLSGGSVVASDRP